MCVICGLCPWGCLPLGALLLPPVAMDTQGSGRACPAVHWHHTGRVTPCLEPQYQRCVHLLACSRGSLSCHCGWQPLPVAGVLVPFESRQHNAGVRPWTYSVPIYTPIGMVQSCWSLAVCGSAVHHLCTWLCIMATKQIFDIHLGILGLL